MSANPSWSYDPRLDPYRDAVWELSLDGQVRAHLVTRVTCFPDAPLGGERRDLDDLREWLWCKVCWNDGRQERPEEDYGPDWYTVSELESGTFESESHPGLRFDAKRVEGPLRDRVWSLFGPP